MALTIGELCGELLLLEIMTADIIASQRPWKDVARPCRC